MKKILISTLAVMALRCVAFAGPDTTDPLIASSFSSTTTNYVTNAVINKAWVDALIFDWTDGGGGSTQTGTVTIATAGGTGGGPSRTIYTATVAATDSVVYPRATAVGTTGSALSTLIGERIPLIGDKLAMTVYVANTNTTSIKVIPVLSPVP